MSISLLRRRRHKPASSDMKQPVKHAKTCKPRSTRPLRRLPESELFIELAERLSDMCGINRATVRRKMVDNLSPNAEEETIKRFLDAEEKCGEFNHRLFGLKPDYDTPIDVESFFEGRQLALRSVLYAAIRYINDVLCLPWETSDHFYLGPGMAYVDKSFKTTSAVDKISGSYNTWSTPNERFNPFNFWDSHFAQHIDDMIDYDSIHIDQISQVPKNNDVNRTIGVGCTVGIAAQRVCGEYIRRCLRKRGINLDTLAETHRTLAYLGSLYEGYNTIDFSMASDTISQGLVALLFNSNLANRNARTLYKRMRECRSTHYRIGKDGEILEYEKHSAMGNGYTFDLESLSFAALSYGIQLWILGERGDKTPRRDPTSNGDDVILDIPIPSDEEIAFIIESFNTFGLTVNPEKSFFKGQFRESCGADFLNGRFVRGVYLHSCSVYVNDVLRVLNFFRIRYGVDTDIVIAQNSWLDKLLKREGVYQAATAPEHGALDPLNCCYIDIPDNVLITNLVPDTRSFIAYRQCEKVNSEAGNRETEILSTLLPLDQRTLIGTPIMVERDKTRLVEFIDDSLGVRNPIIWIKGILTGRYYRIERLHRNGWEREIRYHNY